MDPRDKHPPGPPEPSSSSNAGTAQGELRWKSALHQLRHRSAQLLELRNRGSVRVQRLIGRASTLLPPSPYGGLCGVFDTLPLTVENVLLGSTQGIYALEFNGEVRWHCPPERFVIYLRELRISAELSRQLQRGQYTVSFDRAPREVLAACASEHGSGQGQWLSQRLENIYLELFEMGALHSVEAWQGRTLVGGSFGLTMGSMWISESMFSHVPEVGALQFAATAQHLLERGYQMVDGQQYSDHFARFGAREIPIAQYRVELARGLAAPARFYPDRGRPAANGGGDQSRS